MYLWTSIRVRELLEETEQPFAVVPQLVGQTVREAKEIADLTAVLLKMATDMGDEVTIAGQSPEAGTLCQRGATVEIWA